MHDFTVCADDLTRMSSIKLSVSSSKSPTFVNGSIVHSRHAWCAKTAATSEYLKVDLGSVSRITGFGIQGDTENDQWPTKIKIGVSNCSTTIFELTAVSCTLWVVFLSCRCDAAVKIHIQLNGF